MEPYSMIKNLLYNLKYFSKQNKYKLIETENQLIVTG